MKEVFTPDQLYNMVLGQVCADNSDVEGGWLSYAYNLDDVLEAYELMSEDEKKEIDEKIVSEAYRYKDQLLDMVKYSDYDSDEDFMEAKEDSVRYITDRISESLSEYLI